MKQCWLLRLLVVLGVLSVLSFTAAYAQYGKSIGQVTALEGKVTVLH